MKKGLNAGTKKSGARVYLQSAKTSVTNDLMTEQRTDSRYKRFISFIFLPPLRLARRRWNWRTLYLPSRRILRNNKIYIYTIKTTISSCSQSGIKGHITLSMTPRRRDDRRSDGHADDRTPLLCIVSRSLPATRRDAARVTDAESHAKLTTTSRCSR